MAMQVKLLTTSSSPMITQLVIREVLKHVAINLHFVHEPIEDGSLLLLHISIARQ